MFIPNLDKSSKIPQYIQLFRAIESCIIDGQLSSGSKLPASRPLSNALNVSRNTVKAAFELLLAEGYIETQKGSGSFVSKNSALYLPKVEVGSELSGQGAEIVFSDLMHRLNWQQPNTSFSQGLLAPALPAMSEFPWMQWQRAINYAGRVMKHEAVSSSLGYEELRAQISSYLQVVRGVKCDKENILIFSGSQQAIYFALQLLINPGESVFVEDPCYFGIEGAIQALGAVKIAVDVDEQGFNLHSDDYEKSKLAVVTPSRNYPLGHTLSLKRRLGLLQWAKEHNAWIIEDDYDSEFRFDGPPLTSLQGLSSDERVIYAGTFSRILQHSTRIGYLVLPQALVEPFSAAKRLIHGAMPILPQIALAKFMSSGYFSSHVRKMRKLYSSRRDLLQALVSQHISQGLTLVPSDGGMHCVYLLDQNLCDVTICQAVREHNVTIQALSTYYSGNDVKQGLILGFAAFNQAEQEKALIQLAKVIRHFLDASSSVN